VRGGSSCKPIPDAVVDIWHADAGGAYSGFDGAANRTRYLRGAQVTNKSGVAEFTTVYPGWYQGRTTHIHAKVHIDNATALTTQLFFDDELNAKVYATAPYADRGQPDR
jgi:protocatechuate 3,4-dioxygenase beta subunit